MKLFLLFVAIISSASLYAQDIINTLGSGGTFTVKNSSSNALVVIDEITGQLSATRVKVEGVPSFTAGHVTEDNLGTTHDLVGWTESGTGLHDNGGNFDHSTGLFTVPRNGFYFFSVGIELGPTGTSGAALYLMVNSVVTSLADRAGTLGSVANLSVSGVLKLNAADVVSLRVTMTGSLGDASAILGYFSGYLVSDF